MDRHNSPIPESLPPPLPRQSRLAWWSLFLGILANMILPIVASLPGILCGHLALRAMRRDPHLSGRQLARTGLALNYLSLVAVVVLVLLLMILIPLYRLILPDLIYLFPALANWL